MFTTEMTFSPSHILLFVWLQVSSNTSIKTWPGIYPVDSTYRIWSDVFLIMFLLASTKLVISKYPQSQDFPIWLLLDRKGVFFWAGNDYTTYLVVSRKLYVCTSLGNSQAARWQGRDRLYLRQNSTNTTVAPVVPPVVVCCCLFDQMSSDQPVQEQGYNVPKIRCGRWPNPIGPIRLFPEIVRMCNMYLR